MSVYYRGIFTLHVDETGAVLVSDLFKHPCLVANSRQHLVDLRDLISIALGDSLGQHALEVGWRLMRLIDSPDISWETKYGVIFDEANTMVSYCRRLNLDTRLYIPDGSYEEDVLAYRSWLSETLKILERITEVL